jgi:hypothetical protein
MTIPTSSARNDYDGTDITGPYPITWKFFENADLLVTVDGVVKTLTTDYTATGAGEQAGGSLTFTAAISAGAKISIEPRGAFDQETDIRNEGGNLRVAIEDRFDRLCRDDQVVKGLVDRSLKVRTNEASTFDCTLPEPTANYTIAVNAANTGFKLVAPTSVTAIGQGTDLGDGSVTATGSTTARDLKTRFGDMWDAQDFGASGDGTTNNSTIFAGISAGRTIVVSNGTYRISADCTIVCDLDFRNGGKLSVDTGKTVTINGQVYAGNYQIFAGLGTISGTLGLARINVYWFGAVSDGAGDGTGTDNQPAFAKAITLANAWALGYFREVHIPTGNFTIATRIDIPSGVKFNGDGPYATNLYAKAGYNGGVVDPLGVLRTLEGGHGQPPGCISNLALGGNYFLPYGQIGILLGANASSCRNVWLGGFGASHIKCASTNQILDSVVCDNALVGQPSVGFEVVAPGVQMVNCLSYQQQISMYIHDIPTNYGKVPIQVLNFQGFLPLAGGYGILVNTTNGMPVRISDAVLMSDATTGYENGGVVLQSADNTVVDNCLVEFPSACTAAQKGYIISGTSVGVGLINCSSKYCDYGVSCASSQVVIRGGRHANHISYGVLVTAVSKTIVQDAVVAGPGVGFYLADGADNVCITGCVAFDCSTGFTIVQNAGAYNVLKNCHSVSTADLTVTGTAANLIKSGNTNRAGAI